MSFESHPGKVASARTCRKCGALFAGMRCKTCKRVLNRAYAESHPELHKTACAKHYEKNREKVNAATAARRAADPEGTKASRAAYYQAAKSHIDEKNRRYRQENPERSREYTLKWLRANPGYTREKAHERRTLERSGGRLSRGIVQKLFKLQRGLCACCRQPLGDYHLDHIVPLAAGGTNVDSNVQLLTARCNLKKGKKDPIAYMQSKGLLL